MKDINLNNLPKKKKSRLEKKYATLSFVEEWWLVHTKNSITQKMIANYLAEHADGTKTEVITYKNEKITCFEIYDLEMLMWLQENSDDFPCIFLHKEKNTPEEWVKLGGDTKVKK